MRDYGGVEYDDRGVDGDDDDVAVDLDSVSITSSEDSHFYVAPERRQRQQQQQHRRRQQQRRRQRRQDTLEADEISTMSLVDADEPSLSSGRDASREEDCEAISSTTTTTTTSAKKNGRRADRKRRDRGDSSFAIDSAVTTTTTANVGVAATAATGVVVVAAATTAAAVAATATADASTLDTDEAVFRSRKKKSRRHDETITTATTTTAAADARDNEIEAKRRRVDVKRRSSGNQHLSRALDIRNGQDMVRVACNNRSNFDNVELMEWSEAVLLQLCYINEPLDFNELDWQTAKQILYYQWRSEVTLPLQEHVGSKETLSNIIIRNHARKLAAGLIRQNEMFTETTREHLTINYRLLSEYAAENKRRERTSTINLKLKLH